MKWLWYMCEPALRTVYSYVNDSPGMTAGWLMTGTPSIPFGTYRPCEWMVVGCGSSLCSTIWIRSPTLACSCGPGTVPL